MGATIGTYDPETMKPVDKKLELVNLEYYDDHSSLLTHFVEAVTASGWCGREELIGAMKMADLLVESEAACP